MRKKRSRARTGSSGSSGSSTAASSEGGSGSSSRSVQHNTRTTYSSVKAMMQMFSSRCSWSSKSSLLRMPDVVSMTKDVEEAKIISMIVVEMTRDRIE